MSTDAMRLQDLFPYLHVAWSGPLQIVLSIYFLWQQLGASVLVGIAVMLLLMIPMNMYLSGRVRKAFSPVVVVVVGVVVVVVV
jgi:hypothetical protein